MGRSEVFEQMTREVHEVNEVNGWFEQDRPVMTGHMLLVTEVAEASEAWRQWGLDDATESRPESHGRWCKAHGWSGPCPGVDCPLPKPEGVGSEYADVLIRLLDQCERDGVDLVYEFGRKLEYNATRGRFHGGKAV